MFLKFITRLYRLYIFYSSPSKYVIRKAINLFFQNGISYKTCLEIGSGNEMMSPVLRVACKSDYYISSDIDPLENTKLVCDAQALPISDESIDLVASFEVIEHIPNTDRFLSEIARVLTAEGVVVLSSPLLYGRHDFHDYYRWTKQGMEYLLESHGMKMCLIQNRGGTFLTIVTLFSNYIYSLFTPANNSWRAKGLGKKIYYGVMSILMLPLVLFSWICFWIDALIDKDSSNPHGIVCIAKKIAVNEDPSDP